MSCPACGGDGAELGSLGMRVHYRCRDCGIDYSEKIAATVASARETELIEAAAEAAEIFDADELERYVAAHPHFNNTAPHRYENGACVYCGLKKT